MSTPATDAAEDDANKENPAYGRTGTAYQRDVTYDGSPTTQPPQPLNQGELFDTDKGITA